MGPKMTVSQIIDDLKTHTTTHSYEQLKDQIPLINSAFQQNHQKLRLNLCLSSSSVRFEPTNWKKSTVKGYLQVIPIAKQQELSQNHPTSSYKQPIILSYEDVNLLHTLMKNTTQLNNPSKRHSLKHPQQTPTPTTQQNQCCICFQKLPSMVLPCSHAFCDICTIKYIIESQQKKCPQCRNQITGTRHSVEKQIYTLIQQDEQVFEQLRHDILQILSNLNSRIVQNIQQIN